MPRTYSFDHYQSVNPMQAKSERRGEAKELLADQETPEEIGSADGKIHYGEKFKMTKEMFAARAMNSQFEKLARDDSAVSDVLPDLKKRETRNPIGAMPATGETFKEDRFGEVTESAKQYLHMIGGAAKDITMAGLQLVLLPLAAARVLSRRLMPHHN